MTKTHSSHSGQAAIALGLGLQLMPLGGCGGPDSGLAQESVSLEVDNGLSTNGLSTNGLSTNGLSTNGLSTNGLSTNGFNAWWNSNSASISDMVMKYLVRCAVPEGQSRTFTSAAHVTYEWNGELGLAPDWAAGAPATLLEQQLVSACLAAHVNKFGVNVSISVLGYNASGTAIPLGPTELVDYSVKEGCFFGNLFNGDGTFVGNDTVWSPSQSSSRDCAMVVGNHSNCLPMVYAGSCHDVCQPDSAHNAYLSCWHNRQSYPVITTRVTKEVIYRCGDNICQISEHCGTGRTPDNCQDCGPCPNARFVW